MIGLLLIAVYAWSMRPFEISPSSSALPPDLQGEVTALIRLGKLSADDTTSYDGWVLARAQDTGGLMGCVGLELRSPHAYMESLVVHPDARRQGLGRALTQRLFDLYVADDAKYMDMVAMTLFWNNRFYESLGFERVDPRMAKAADDVAAKEKHRYCTVWRKNK